MQDRFDRCLDGLLPGGGAVLLAVSGGVDSMVMADLFLNTSTGIKFVAAHCNFHLRGEESDSDEAFVREWSESHGIRFLKADFDTAEYAVSNGISIEMAARELRYTWFASLLEDLGCSAVAVAHNANDNAETLILNLLRGTGIKGICGMRESSFIQGSDNARLIRPLLGFSREEIQGYALSHCLAWREDSSNADPAYKRNLVRNEVLPAFGKLNPSFLRTLGEDMRRFDQVRRIADDFVAANAPGVCRPGHGWTAGEASGSQIVVDTGKLQGVLHWEYLLYRLLEPYGFNSSTIDDIVGLIRNGGTFSGKKFFADEYIATTSDRSIVVSRFDGPGAHGGSEGRGRGESGLVVNGPGKYSLDGIGLVVENVVIDEPRQPVGTTVVNLGFPFAIRHWQAGDWMRPLGMGGRRKKLSDMFTDLKLSPFEKERALVIPDEGSHVLALLGHRIDESVRVAEGPVVRIRLI